MHKISIDSQKNNSEDLLLLSVHLSPNENIIKKLKEILRHNIDWGLFLTLASKSGMAKTVYTNLSNISRRIPVPGYVLEKLKFRYISIIQKTESQYRETLAILKVFSAKGIPVVPLKGPLLSKRLYGGDITARGASVDLDLLVKEKNAEDARRILEFTGYRCASWEEDGGTKKLWGQTNFHKTGNSTIDLHWKIGASVLGGDTTDAFWEGIRSADENSTEYYELNEEELLLHLSVHFVSSARLRHLRYVCDIHQLLSKYVNTMDWTKITDKAIRLNLSGSLYATLMFTKALFDSDVPKGALVKLRPNLPTVLLVKLLANKKTVLRSDSRERHFIDTFLKHIIFQLFEARSFKDYVAILFPPKEIIGDKSYLRLFIGGITKFIKAIIR
ncbi:MAG: nucleotidyltransferase family protein [Candidatus Omnitrophota bacterium]